ncbi:MAG TPA: hypothetical protein VGB71_12525 [Flavisolibacter sp.]|jgi:hypothetical protein
MKQHLAAIAFNEKELEVYVSQLKTQRFEVVSDVKKAEDGTFFQLLAKAVKEDGIIQKKVAETVASEMIT